MSRVRRAFLMSSFEQYMALLVNFAMIVVLARLLTPAQIGLAVVGMGLSATIFSLREFATADFLIQRHKVDGSDIRTAFTLGMALALLLAVALHFASNWISEFYDEPSLRHFLALTLLAAILDTTAMPTIALLRREMAFGVLARIRTSASVISAATTVTLAWLGYGSISYAWGLLAGGCATATLACAARPAWEDFRPSLASWRELVAFGRYRGATSTVEKIYETLPQMLLGHIMPMSAVGYYNRANAVCGIPDRVILSPIFAIAFPALAAQVRDGKSVKEAYLRLLSYISVAYWPALIVLALTADAVVHIILGRNWEEVIPVVRLLALAGLFWFPVIPTSSMLLAMGRNRDSFMTSLISRSVSAVILSTASFHGIIAVAASQFLALPFQMAVALRYARKHAFFTWRELLDAIAPGAIVAVWASAGPLAIAMMDNGLEFSLLEFLFAAITAAIGWIAGLYWTEHPLLDQFLEQARGYCRSITRLFDRRSAFPAK